MHIFINHTHIHIHDPREILLPEHYDQVINLENAPLRYNTLRGKVLIRKSTTEIAVEILRLVLHDRFTEVPHIAFQCLDPKLAKKAIKKNFKIIKAGGGLVEKEDKVLMIYRHNKWDLPKGKMDEGESFKETAHREVEEECRVKVEVKKKIVSTWHHYKMGETRILKHTKWYQMRCLDDSQMTPQIEEDIHDVRWMNQDEVKEALKNTYNTIAFIFEKYYG